MERGDSASSYIEALSQLCLPCGPLLGAGKMLRQFAAARHACNVFPKPTLYEHLPHIQQRTIQSSDPFDVEETPPIGISTDHPVIYN